MKLTFSKNEKLKSRKQIQQLFEEGFSVKQHPLRLKYLRIDELDIQTKVAFSVPKRNIKLAVDRNRIKRLMREAFRLHRNDILADLEGQYILMFIYTDKVEWSFEDLEKKMILIIRKFVQAAEK